MFFYLRIFLTEHTLSMLCYSFVDSHHVHGIKAWDTAHQIKLHEIEVKVHNNVRTITKSKKFCHVMNLYKKLNFLKLCDIHKLKPAKFIHKLLRNKLSNVLKQNL